jgi:hypothetical protein
LTYVKNNRTVLHAHLSRSKPQWSCHGSRPIRTAPQRAQRYLEQAEKLRLLAGAESVAKIRDVLIVAAEQYQQLAESLLEAKQPDLR